jgi:hypothetical protein
MGMQRAPLWFVLAWLASASCSAEIICATSSDELRQAFVDAAADGIYDEIRLQEGIYYTGGQAFAFNAPGHHLTISGGWYQDHDPCDFQHPRADGTILDGQNVTAVLSITTQGDVPGTAVSVSNMTLRNGATSTNGESAALAIFPALEQDVRVQNVVFLSSHNTSASSNIFTNVVTLETYADVYFINNVFADCSGTYANLAIFAQSAAQTVYMNNNSLSFGGAPLSALLDSNGGTVFRIVNNAILGELRLNSRSAANVIHLFLYSNIGQWDANDPFNAPSIDADVGNDYAIDPKFTSATDFRPAAGSPLVNRGLNSPFGGSSAQDLDGNPRVDLGFIDAGAFESTRERIFAGGFN